MTASSTRWRASFPLVKGFVTGLAAVVASVAALVVAPPAVAQQTVRSMQWHLAFLHAAQADRLAHNGTGVTVAVLDTGVDRTHPDLAGSHIAPGYDEVLHHPGVNVDLDGHGTAMVGLIAASGGNGTGALGMAPRVTILPVRVDAGRVASPSAVAAGLRWAADHGAEVINVSLGEPAQDPAVASAVAYAQSKNAVVVASAGNTVDGDDGVVYPAAYPGVVAVSAVDRHGRFAAASVHGPQVALAAPGVDIVSPAGRHLYARGVGTSGSAALVSATAALVRAAHPRLDAADVINRLIRTADDAGSPGRDDEYGFGIVDPVKAISAPVPAVASNPLASATSAAATPPASSPAARPSPLHTPTSTSASSSRGGGVATWPWVVVGVLLAVALMVAAGFWRRSHRAVH